MRDPFSCSGRTAVSFSGGRTSAYMLRRVLDAKHEADAEIRVVFANTGKERPETLDFIHEVETRWKVAIDWIEYDPETRFRVVDYASASRNGEPFLALIRKRNFLPNPVARICTQELKVKAMLAFHRARGWESWDSLIGIRYDEPRRWRVRGSGPAAPGEERRLPLADAAVSRAEVDAFWVGQPFRLDFQPWEGNCDLCFLKARSDLERVIRDRPDLATWWVESEAMIAGRSGPGTFRSDRPSYAQMRECAVIAPSQINRAVESRTNRRPTLGDLRESGAIEQDADEVLLMYRDEYYDPASSAKGTAEVQVAKQRNGPTGLVTLAFRPETCRFTDLSGRSPGRM